MVGTSFYDKDQAMLQALRLNLFLALVLVEDQGANLDALAQLYAFLAVVPVVDKCRVRSDVADLWLVLPAEEEKGFVRLHI